MYAVLCAVQRPSVFPAASGQHAPVGEPGNKFQSGGDADVHVAHRHQRDRRPRRRHGRQRSAPGQTRRTCERLFVCDTVDPARLVNQQIKQWYFVVAGERDGSFGADSC